jgi:membrane-associated phospholipid phosphatase
VKLVVRRPRPRLEDLPPLTDTVSELSYPSAHASTSFAAARAFSPALPGPPLYAVAAAMALSRPYLGVHFVSDSLAGAALGSAVAELVP